MEGHVAIPFFAAKIDRKYFETNFVFNLQPPLIIF